MSNEISYKTITPIQLCNGLAALLSGIISFRAFRVYLGCFELVAIREAAGRDNKRKGKRVGEKVRFRLEELKNLCSVASLGGIRREVNSLRKANLLDFTESQITITQTPLPYSLELLDDVLGQRKKTRPIPVPRRILRYLASSTKPVLAKTLIAYLLRGPSLKPKTEEINSRGTVKASWIADTFSCSLRGVKQARLDLIELGIISKDENSYQRKLNRDGAYFELNMTWGREESAPQAVDNSLNKTSKTVTQSHEFAPPRVQTCHEFAPPIERLKTSNEVKNQKTRRAEPSGVCKQTFSGDKPPSIRDIQPEDLREFSRNEALYWQARSRELISSSEADILNWIAASIRARETKSPGRVFMGIIKRKLFHHITQAQEDQARRALNRRREKHFEAYREQAPERLAA